MARWEPDARRRLMEAALDLFERQGYDATTVAEIAERAGLTERTFFRHYADKREVLFTGEIHAAYLEGLRAALGSATPLDAVLMGLEAGAAAQDENRDRARRRLAVMDAHPALRERGLVKYAALTDDLAGALEEAGTDAGDARLAAEVGMAIYRTAMARWTHEPGASLADLLRDTAARMPAPVA